MGENYYGSSGSYREDSVMLLGVNPNIKPSLLLSLAVLKDNEEIAFIDSSYKTTALRYGSNCLGLIEGSFSLQF